MSRFNFLMNFPPRLLLFIAFAVGAMLRPAAWAEPVITEFMASNKTIHPDDDGDFSDWVEIHNPDATPLDLNGWYLTDNAKKKDKWRFPAVVMAPNSYLLVYTSDKDRRDPLKALHANFALSADGEYLGLIKPDATTASSEYSPKFPAQSPDISYGVTQPTNGESAQSGFFGTPTPGARNGDASTLVLPERATFSRASGMFTGTFALTLSGAASGQKIRYVVVPPSTAGASAAEPTASSPVYSGPLTIDSSVLIRAAVFSADDSRRGLSSVAYYGRISNTDDLRADTFTSALPIVVIDNHGTGPLVKDDIDRPAWVHVFAPDATGVASPAVAPTLSLPATTKIRGFSSAEFPKKSYNFTLQNEAGRDNPQAVLGLDQSADWAVVSPWYFDPAYIRNAYTYALSNRIGRWAPRTRFAELFFKSDGGALSAGDYQGITVLTDRIKIGTDRIDIASLSPTDTSAPAITGGYILKIEEPDAEHFSWITDRNFPSNPGGHIVVDSPKADKLPQAQRDYIRGYWQDMENALFADRDSGWATRNYANYIDVPSWVDHHLLEILVGNVDAFQRSDYFYKDRGGKLVSGPAWDFDRALGSQDGRDANPATWSTSGDFDVWNLSWWGLLVRDPEFMQAWVDRWQSLRRTEFAADKLAALADSLAAQIGTAAAARDAARWPDNQGRFPDGFIGEVNHLKQWITTRADWIDTQFLARPIVTSDGLRQIVITAAPGAQIAYTLDGSDPRAVGGGLSPNALLVSSPLFLDLNLAFTARSYNPNVAGIPNSPWSSALVSVPVPTDGGIDGAPRLAALSSRGTVGANEDILIAGVAVNSAVPKRFLVRAVGPTLGTMGVPNTITDPTVRIFTADGTLLAANTGWETGPDAAALAAASLSIGISPLPAGSRDSALIAQLSPGAYSIQVSNNSSQAGVGLAEIYELDEVGNATALSTRGLVREGEGILIGGLVVRGPGMKRLLIRGIGPSLAGHGVGGVLPDPVLSIYQGQAVISSNDDWGSSTNAAQLPAAATAAGTFPLTDGKDAALIVTLPAGVYTVQLSGKTGAQGVGMLEVYELPANP